MADITTVTDELRMHQMVMAQRGTAGEALAKGEFVYKSDGGWVKVDATAVGTCPIFALRGLVMNSAVASGEPVDVLIMGDFGGFSGMTEGAPAYASETAGALADAMPEDVDTVVLVAGYAKSATVITLVGPQLGIVN